MQHREFTISNEYRYDRRSPARWVLAHMLRYPVLPVVFILTAIGMAAAQSLGAVFVGRAFDVLIGGGGLNELAVASLWVVAAYLGYGATDIVNSLALRVLGQRVERDTRAELWSGVDRGFPADAPAYVGLIGGLIAEQERHPELIDAFRRHVLLPRRAIAQAAIERGQARGDIRSDLPAVEAYASNELVPADARALATQAAAAIRDRR